MGLLIGIITNLLDQNIKKRLMMILKEEIYESNDTKKTTMLSIRAVLGI